MLALRLSLLGQGFNTAETVLSLGWDGNADAGYNAHEVLLQKLLTVRLVGTVALVCALAILAYRWLTLRQCTLSTCVTPYILVLGLAEVHIALIPALLTLMVRFDHPRSTEQTSGQGAQARWSV